MAGIHSAHKKTFTFSTSSTRKKNSWDIKTSEWMVGARTLAQSISFMVVYSMDIAATSRVAKPLTPSTVTHWRNSEKTQETSQDIFVRTVLEMWECEWHRQKHHNAHIKRFTQSSFPALKPFQSACPITEQAVLDAVKNDTLFGLIECDIHVPTILKIILVSYNLFSKTCHLRDNVLVHSCMSTLRRTNF